MIPAETFPGIAWQRPDGQWRLSDPDWGDFAGASLTEAYDNATAYITRESGAPVTLTVALRRPGAPADSLKRDPHGLED